MAKRIQKHLIVQVFKDVVKLVENDDKDLVQAFNEIYITTEKEQAVAAKLVAKNLEIAIGPGKKKNRDYLILADEEKSWLSETQAAKYLGYNRAEQFFKNFVLNGHIEPIMFPNTKRRYLKDEVSALRDKFRLTLRE